MVVFRQVYTKAGSGTYGKLAPTFALPARLLQMRVFRRKAVRRYWPAVVVDGQLEPLRQQGLEHQSTSFRADRLWSLGKQVEAVQLEPARTTRNPFRIDIVRNPDQVQHRCEPELIPAHS